MPTRLSTGIDILDQRLGGGLPTGSVLALCASPASQAELLLYEFTVPRETLYLTLDRTERTLTEGLDATTARTGDPTVRAVPDDGRLTHALEALEDLPAGATLVVDPHSALEAEDRSEYVAFMRRLRRRVADTGSLAVLHCLDGRDVPPLRDTTEYLADAVFTLTTKTGGAQIENRLAVPKFRGGRALTDTLKLRLTDGVEVDTSRDIA